MCNRRPDRAAGPGEISLAEAAGLVQFKHICTPGASNRAAYDDRWAVFLKIHRQVKNADKHMNS